MDVLIPPPAMGHNLPPLAQAPQDTGTLNKIFAAATLTSIAIATAYGARYGIHMNGNAAGAAGVVAGAGLMAVATGGLWVANKFKF